MGTVVDQIDDRFSVDEMISTTEIQQKPKRLQKMLEEHVKLLVTYYNRPTGVMMPIDVFRTLVKRHADLLRLVEDMNDAKLIAERQDAPDEQWMPRDGAMAKARAYGEAYFKDKDHQVNQ